MQQFGGLEQQAVLIQSYCTTGDGRPIGVALGMYEDSDSYWAVADTILNNAREYFDTVKGLNTNDAIGARNTVLLCLGSRAPFDSDSD